MIQTHSDENAVRRCLPGRAFSSSSTSASCVGPVIVRIGRCQNCLSCKCKRALQPRGSCGPALHASGSGIAFGTAQWQSVEVASVMQCVEAWEHLLQGLVAQGHPVARPHSLDDVRLLEIQFNFKNAGSVTNTQIEPKSSK